MRRTSRCGCKLLSCRGSTAAACFCALPRGSCSSRRPSCSAPFYKPHNQPCRPPLLKVVPHSFVGSRAIVPLHGKTTVSLGSCAATGRGGCCRCCCQWARQGFPGQAPDQAPRGTYGLDCSRCRLWFPMPPLCVPPAAPYRLCCRSKGPSYPLTFASCTSFWTGRRTPSRSSSTPPRCLLLCNAAGLLLTFARQEILRAGTGTCAAAAAAAAAAADNCCRVGSAAGNFRRLPRVRRLRHGRQAAGRAGAVGPQQICGEAPALDGTRSKLFSTLCRRAMEQGAGCPLVHTTQGQRLWPTSQGALGGASKRAAARQAVHHRFSLRCCGTAAP